MQFARSHLLASPVHTIKFQGVVLLSEWLPPKHTASETWQGWVVSSVWYTGIAVNSNANTKKNVFTLTFIKQLYSQCLWKKTWVWYFHVRINSQEIKYKHYKIILVKDVCVWYTVTWSLALLLRRRMSIKLWLNASRLCFSNKTL